jgi:hypothetical protein
MCWHSCQRWWLSTLAHALSLLHELCRPRRIIVRGCNLGDDDAKGGCVRDDKYLVVIKTDRLAMLQVLRIGKVKDNSWHVVQPAL